MTKLLIIACMCLTACSSAPRFDDVTYAYVPQSVENPNYYSPFPVVTTKSSCTDNKFYICNIKPVGSLSEYVSIDSAIACGRCIDGVAQGPIVGVWCKIDKCKNVDITNNQHLFGRIIGNSSNGLISGSGVTLVTSLGAFQGRIAQDGSYDLGFLKKDSMGNGFIGKFNSNGTYNHGVEIRKNPSGKFTLVAADFENNLPVGIAYYYDDGQYKTYTCDVANGCKLYDFNIVNDQIRKVLNVLAQEVLENVLFQSPIKRFALALLPKTNLVRDVEKAYELWGNVQTVEKIGNALSN